jgi:HupE / UreJ protein
MPLRQYFYRIEIEYFMFKKITQYLFLYILIHQSNAILAHPMPNTLINLMIQEKAVVMSIQIPLNDFEIVFDKKIADLKNPNEAKNALNNYLQNHIKVSSFDGLIWKLELISYAIRETTDPIVGNYNELQINLTTTPTKPSDLRDFTLQYDVVMHQVVTHKALVNITYDWANGIVEKNQSLGVIEMDVVSNKIHPFTVSLGQGGLWVGFKNMIKLGMSHIAEGIDHLLFLLTLLLPAPLLLNHKKWGQFGGLRYSILKLLKIITAFTLGHSFTLLLGTLGLVHFSSRLIEIVIAFSIFISTVHVLKPLFFNKEIYIAIGFGLIHGLAFSNTLSPLNLDNVQMGLSILGFNLGIEIMQLGIITLILPWLLMMSQTKMYRPFRIVCATLSGIAAIAWMIERITNNSNFITLSINNLMPFSLWVLCFIALLSTFSFYFNKRGPSVFSQKNGLI